MEPPACDFSLFMSKLHERLARAYAPETIVEQLNQLDELKRMERIMRADQKNCIDQIVHEVERAEYKSRVTPPAGERNGHDSPLFAAAP